ncbi:MAG: FAD-dependent oxidoreductase [Caulobacter sp.]|nr:FAD-dependent oxidoreductase [Caulobacter sp.]
MTEHVDILVVGAGPAGLAAADALVRAGRAVTVLEADPEEVGGRGRTVTHGGFRIDQDGRSFETTDPAVQAFWEDLPAGGFVGRPRVSSLYHRERFHAYPLKALRFLSHQGLSSGLAALASLGLARLSPIRAPRTVLDEIRNRFGRRLAAALFQPFVEKVSGLSCAETPAGMAGAESGEIFRYPVRGSGAVWDACADRIRANGGRIRLDRRVERLAYDEAERRWTVEARGADGAIEILTALQLVSTLPLRELAKALHPTPISVFHAGELMYRDQVTVALIGRPARILDEDAIEVHDQGLQASRVENYGAWTAEMAPAGDLRCLGLEYFCFEGDGLWTARDEDLVALAWREAAVMGVMSPDTVVDARVLRRRKVRAIQDEACDEHRRMVLLDLRMQFPTLHLAGGAGLHQAGGREDAVASGLAAARAILAGDVPSRRDLVAA